jgi:hypothetical protein
MAGLSNPEAHKGCDRVLLARSCIREHTVNQTFCSVVLRTTVRISCCDEWAVPKWDGWNVLIDERPCITSPGSGPPS